MNADHMERFFVEVSWSQHGTSLRNYEIWHEAFHDRASLIRDILSGQFDRCWIETIWHASTDAPLTDITREIREEVRGKAKRDVDDDGFLTFGHLKGFLEAAE